MGIVLGSVNLFDTVNEERGASVAADPSPDDNIFATGNAYVYQDKVAQRIIISSTTTVTAIGLKPFNFQFSTNKSWSGQLFSDSGGNPGTLIAAATNSILESTNSNNPSVLPFNVPYTDITTKTLSFTGSVLSPGTYWLVLTASNPGGMQSAFFANSSSTTVKTFSGTWSALNTAGLWFYINHLDVDGSGKGYLTTPASPYTGVANRFIPTSDRTIASVTFMYKNIAATGSVTAKIFADSGGLPGSVLYTSSSISVNTTIGVDVPVTFPFTGAAVIAGVTYWVGIDTGAGYSGAQQLRLTWFPSADAVLNVTSPSSNLMYSGIADATIPFTATGGRYGTKFTVGSTTTVSSFGLKFARSASPANNRNYTAQLWTNVGGAPGTPGTLLSTSTNTRSESQFTVSASLNTALMATQVFNFSGAGAILAAGDYWIVVYPDGATSDSWSFGGGGQYGGRFYSGGAWQGSGQYGLWHYINNCPGGSFYLAYYSTSWFKDILGAKGSPLDFLLTYADNSTLPPITGAQTVANVGGVITMVSPVTVQSGGDLTLDVASPASLVRGGQSLTVQAGGQLRLTGRAPITVQAGTIYVL